MKGGAGLRRTSYGGDDPAADQAFRSVYDQISYFQKVPATNGMLFENQDFGESTSSKVVQLRHTLNRKARGVMVMSVRPKNAATPSCPQAYPVHMPTLDDTRAANVFLTSDLAKYFIWSFWVW